MIIKPITYHSDPFYVKSGMSATGNGCSHGTVDTKKANFTLALR